ncbi:MAG: hypothetical protein KY459_16470 [Acidobacteria bacterium]|nr:hypothetical protein [Acidobacteriota bacterium]
MKAGTVLFCLALSFAVVPAHAAETVMFPILRPDPQPGAHGSLWMTSLLAYNGGNTVETVGFDCQLLCPSRTEIAPGETKRVGYSGLGVVLTIKDGSALVFQLRAFDVSRANRSRGVELPVLRGDDDYRLVIDLLDVPLDENSRSALRIYSFNGPGPGRGALITVVRAYDRASALLAETPVELEDRTSIPRREIYDLTEIFPTLAGQDSLRLEILSPEPDASTGRTYPIYAFVTTANNITQEVTSITPAK